LAGTVVAGGKGGAVRLRSRQHVVTVRRVANAVDHLALLGKRGLLGEVVACAVQVSDVLGNDDAFRVLPGPLADAVLRVHRRLAVGRLRRKIGAPGFRPRPRGLRQRLAMTVGAGNAAEIAALARAVAGQEEAGAGGLRRGRRGRDNGKRETGRRNEFDQPTHEVPPNCSCYPATGLTRRTRYYSPFTTPERGGKNKSAGAKPRRLHLRCSVGQLVCWIAESSQFPLRWRTKVQTSVTSTG